jgi:rod shape-determining protein MreC
MNQRRRARVVLAVLVLASLVLVTADFRSDGGPLDSLRSIATSAFEPVQSGLSAVARPVVDVFTNAGELLSIREDNVQLRDRVEALEQRELSVDAIQRENGELRALLELRDANAWQTVAASTVAFTPSNFEWTITIDVGSEDGVEEDMPVVEGAGLVGKVIQVTPTSSRVLLAIDPNFAAATRSAAVGDIGVVTGQGSDLMRMVADDPAAELLPGDEIVTNSYQFGVFPHGIPVGIVESTQDVTNELSRSVLVRPFVDFNRLSQVLVILEHPTDAPPPVPDLPERRLDPPQLVPDEPEPTEPPVSEDPDASGDDPDATDPEAETGTQA